MGENRPGVSCLPAGARGCGRAPHRASFRRHQKVDPQDPVVETAQALVLEDLGLNPVTSKFFDMQYRRQFLL